MMLHSPVKIGSKELKNRIVLAPMGTRANLMDGTLTDRAATYYEERAKGGAGLIITEFTSVKEGYSWLPSLQIYSDKLIPSLGRLTESVHNYDTAIVMQLALHGGRAASEVTGKRCIAPSALKAVTYKEVAEELTEDEIWQLVEDWKVSAARAKKAGFDGVEVHCGHGYLLNQFMSPYTNKRTDQWGGSLDNRLRLPLTIIKEIRAQEGINFIVGCKFTAYEHVEGGLKQEDAGEIAKKLEAAGADYLHVSTLSSTIPNHSYCKLPSVPSMYDPKSPLADLAALVKKSVTIPVIAAAGIVTSENGEELIQEGKADLVAVGRGFLADPYWGLRSKQKKPVRPCIGCMNCHLNQHKGQEITCAVNGGLLREYRDINDEITRNPKKLLIVGAGPAGLEAAIQAKDKGHEVILYEKSATLGGALQLAGKPDFKKRTRALLEYYQKEVEVRKLSILFGQEVTKENVDEIIKREHATALLVAVGGKVFIPPIAGLDKLPSYRAEEVIETPELCLPKDRVFIVGGGKVGLETAWMLADRGISVTVADAISKDEILSKDHPTLRSCLLHHVAERNIEILPSCKILEVDKKGVHVERNGADEWIPCNKILFATGFHKNRELYDYLLQSQMIENVFHAGDCKDARGLFEAIHEGYYIGRYCL